MNKRNYDDLLDAGTIAQMEKLKENAHKEGFDNIDVFEAEKLLCEEGRELFKELYDDFDSFTGDFTRKASIDYAAVRREAADVANFAHMIILACDKKIAE